MIDTDKYEGHTPAPWNVKHGDMERYGETDTVVAKDDYHEYQVAEGVMRQDVALIADAPKLLAEVKRWHKVWEILRSKTEMSCVCFAEYPDKQDINTHELMDLAMKEASE